MWASGAGWRDVVTAGSALPASAAGQTPAFVVRGLAAAVAVMAGGSGRQAVQVDGIPPSPVGGADQYRTPPGNSTTRGWPGIRRRPNSSLTGAAARSGAITTRPSASRAKTISPVVSTGVAESVPSGRVAKLTDGMLRNRLLLQWVTGGSAAQP